MGASHRPARRKPKNIIFNEINRKMPKAGLACSLRNSVRSTEVGVICLIVNQYKEEKT
jgi:hypothetical protein